MELRTFVSKIEESVQGFSPQFQVMAACISPKLAHSPFFKATFKMSKNRNNLYGRGTPVNLPPRACCLRGLWPVWSANIMHTGVLSAQQ